MRTAYLILAQFCVLLPQLALGQDPTPRLDGLKLHNDLTVLDRAISRIAAVTRLHAAEHGSHKASKETNAVLESWSVANSLLTEAVAALEQARKPVMAVANEAVTIICKAEDHAWQEEEKKNRT